MTNPWLVTLSTVFIWWFSTGAILWRVRRADLAGRGAHQLSVVLGLPLLALGFVYLHRSADDATVQGAHVAFLSALSVWGWFELAFLSGVVAGPNRTQCPPTATMYERFLRATGTILWHEIALLVAMIACTVIVADNENRIGLMTFAILYVARISAKLNLFLGVPRINVQFLPSPLAHLASHFKIARMNFLFPASVTILTFAAGCFMERAISAESDGAFIGHVLMAVLTLLALLEHWFMVLPLPDQKLWTWMLPTAVTERNRARARAARRAKAEELKAKAFQAPIATTVPALPRARGGK
ncbi:putative photosynthetic complex assembly protein 2 [Rhodobacter sp. JA431]|uniref:putative photosynthetic complex assembly protein PuhE n=1 Tax=Rhodobacter sp. JA431 TaxID=570013 RepID=UPI000BD6863F|nr:putative photosynthetic complex assembly protein PuhE [Rhodobacter sp. JA431]SOB90895.1 putative photosynthetic complex assembly protein 2 [Rhodobacter sp. JA431]